MGSFTNRFFAAFRNLSSFSNV